MPDDQPPSDAGAAPAAGEALRPTVMKPPPARARRSVAETPLASPLQATGALPTAIRGVRRERVAVSARDLRALAPEASDAACAGAAGLLAETAPGTLNERQAVLWGHDVQKAYADAVAGTLAIAQDPLAERARAHVDRMAQILSAIDLLAVCGHGKGGVMAGLARAMNDRIDTPAELAGALAELRLLLDRLGAATSDLAGLADRLRQHGAQIARIEQDVEAAGLAARFLAQHVAHDAPDLARRFTDREMGLAATVAQIRQDDAIRRLQLQQPLDLIGLIQNVALVSLPGLLSGLATLLVLAKSRGASPTQARELAYQVRALVDQFQT